MYRLNLVSLLSVFLLTSCLPKRKPSSKLTTTSDRIKEYTYDLEGTIIIPTDERLIQLSYLFDLLREQSDDSENIELKANIDAILENQSDFENSYLDRFRSSFPIIDEGKVNPTALKFWVHRQLKYSKNFLDNFGVSLTLKDIESFELVNRSSIIPYGDVATIKYKLKAIGVSKIEGIQNGISNSKPLTNGMEIHVPQFNLASFYEMMGGAYKNFLNTVNLKFPNDIRSNRKEIFELIQKEQLIKGTATNIYKSTCFKEDGDHVAPFNYFYYYQAEMLECPTPAKRANLTITAATETPVKTTYPEYHRLFEDNQVDIFVFLGEVDNEESVTRRDMRQRTSRFEPYKEVPVEENPAGLWKIKKKIGDITFVITYAVAKTMDNARSEFEKAIRDAELVVYDGHAGYGANISQYFTKPETYKKDFYQIIFLNGCSTYKYGISQILSAKAIRDFDFLHQNVDLVSTFIAIKGHLQQFAFINELEKVAELYSKEGNEEEIYKDFEEKYSWLGLITKINRVSETSNGNDNGGFLVSGEVDNDYTPGKKSFTSQVQTANASDLKKVVDDRSLEMELRLKALELYISKRISSGENVEQTIDEMSQYCKKFKNLTNNNSLFDQFHRESCHIQKLTASKYTVVRGLRFLKGQTIEFYDNGQLVGGSYGTPKEIEVASGVKIFVSGKTTFHRTGNLKSSYLASDYVVSDSIIFAPGGEIEFYSNGKVKKGKVEETTYNNINIHGETILYQSGKIASTKTNQPYQVNNKITFKYDLRFNENGDVIGGYVNEYDFMGNKVTGNIILHENGAIKSIRLNDVITLSNGMKVASWYPVQFYETGEVLSLKLDENYQYGDFSLNSGRVYLYKNGKVKSSREGLNTQAQYRGVNIHEYRPISFYENGDIQHAYTIGGRYQQLSIADGSIMFDEEQNLRIANVFEEPGGSKVKILNESGKVVGGTIEENLQVNGMTVGSGNVVVYHEDNDTPYLVHVLPRNNFENSIGVERGSQDVTLIFYKSGKLLGLKSTETIKHNGRSFKSIFYNEDGSISLVQPEKDPNREDIDCHNYYSYYYQNDKLIYCVLYNGYENLDGSAFEHNEVVGIMPNGLVVKRESLESKGFFEKYKINEQIKNEVLKDGYLF